MREISKNPENPGDGPGWRYPSAIVDCAWLKDRMGDSGIRIYDCTTYLHYTDDHPSKPYDVGSGRADYAAAHIPQSAYLDLQNDLSDRAGDFSFTLPDLTALAGRFERLGVGAPYHIVLYSRNGMQWATRVWWMLHILGYEQVSILNGGFDEWVRLGLPVDTETTVFTSAQLPVRPNPTLSVDKDDVLSAIEDRNKTLLNALTADIHLGQSTRYGRPGHIPKSKNIPFHLFVDPANGKIVSPHEAQAILDENGIQPDGEIINYCGGGIAATLNYFVMHQLGFPKLSIYDNSMSEWAMDPSLPMETG
ncbi:MAG: sulfurtransferase [Thalassobaculaceae bacterium]